MNENVNDQNVLLVTDKKDNKLKVVEGMGEVVLNCAIIPSTVIRVIIGILPSFLIAFLFK